MSILRILELFKLRVEDDLDCTWKYLRFIDKTTYFMYYASRRPKPKRSLKIERGGIKCRLY